VIVEVGALILSFGEKSSEKAFPFASFVVKVFFELFCFLFAQADWNSEFF
jgi:hypothetical protein